MTKFFLDNNAKKIDIFLKKYLNKEPYSRLIIPMKYSTLSGGKKIRSSLIISVGNLFNIKAQFLTSKVEV